MRILVAYGSTVRLNKFEGGQSFEARGRNSVTSLIRHGERSRSHLAALATGQESLTVLPGYRRRLLATSEFVVAAGAIAGSAGLVRGSINLGDAIDRRLPFESPRQELVTRGIVLERGDEDDEK